MDLRAILFDVNGTLLDIETDEGQDHIYHVISRLLAYQGFQLAPQVIRDRYFAIMEQQRKSSPERFPEFDAVAIWQTMLQTESAAAEGLPADSLSRLPLFLAGLHRTLAHKRLEPYPDVPRVLEELGKQYKLGIVTDAQSAYALPELRLTGLSDLFACVIVSGDYGYRKPDPRLFSLGLKALGVQPNQAIYLGNDMYHDVFGAQQVGLRAVFWPTQWGKKEHPGVSPDYIVYHFAQLRDAVAFLAAR